MVKRVPPLRGLFFAPMRTHRSSGGLRSFVPCGTGHLGMKGFSGTGFSLCGFDWCQAKVKRTQAEQSAEKVDSERVLVAQALCLCYERLEMAVLSRW